MGVPKRPNKQWIYMLALLESNGSKSPTALYKWLKKTRGIFSTEKNQKSQKLKKKSPTLFENVYIRKVRNFFDVALYNANILLFYLSSF